MIKNYSKTGDDQELQYNFRMTKYYSVIAGWSRINFRMIKYCSVIAEWSRITVKLEMINNCKITVEWYFAWGYKTMLSDPVALHLKYLHILAEFVNMKRT